MKQFIVKDQPIFFHNQDFQTIQIKVTFPFKREEKDLAYLHILPNLLQNYCAKFPTEREFSLEAQKLYILTAMCTYTSMGDLSYFSFHFMVPDVPSLGQDMLEEQFQFFCEMMYHPKVDGKGFPQEEVQREVDNLKVNIQKVLKDPTNYAFIKAREAVDPDGIFSSTIYSHPDALETVNREAIYNFYQKNVLQNQPLIHVFGNVEEKSVQKLLKKYFYRNKPKEKIFSFEPNHFLPLKKKPTIVTEDSQFRDSIFITFYGVQDMKEEDRVLLDLVKNLLSSQSSRLLYKKLRDESDLVYSSSCITYPGYGLLAIAAFIHADSMKLAKEKILEVLKDLKKKEVIEEYLPIIKERFRLGQIRKLDDKVALFQDAIIDDLGVDLSTEEYYQKLCDVKVEDVISFMDRIQLNTQYFLKEGANE